MSSVGPLLFSRNIYRESSKTEHTSSSTTIVFPGVLGSADLFSHLPRRHSRAPCRRRRRRRP